MDEKNETTSREGAVEQAAKANVESPESGKGDPGSLSLEEELRVAYAELEAARAKLEEIKAKNPPVAESFDRTGERSADTAASSGAAQTPAGDPDWIPYTPPAQDDPCWQSAGGAGNAPGQGSSQWGSAGQEPWGSTSAGGGACPHVPQGYQPPSYGQQPHCQQQPQQPPQQPYAGQAQSAGTWNPSSAQPQQPSSAGYAHSAPSQPYQPYQPYQQPYYPSSYVQTKDHVAAGLLGIFLGWLGIHKFYLGYNTTGFIMLAVTVIGSLFTFGLAASVMALIGVIEGIIYLVKSQSEFDQLYVFNKREWF